MDTLSAFALGEANRHKELMVFDWIKAAKLIKEKNPSFARAGLSGDWEWTGGTIFSSGKTVTNDYTYLASTWATPELDLDGEKINCFVMQSECSWDESTKWPQEALDILNGEIK